MIIINAIMSQDSEVVAPPGVGDNDAIVILVAGQSNADSKADLGTESGTYPTQNANINIYEKAAFSSADNGSFVSYDATAGNNIHPLNRDNSERYIDDIISLGQKLYEYYGKPVFFIKCARGATYMDEVTGNYNTSGRDFHPNSTDDYFVALTEWIYDRAIQDLIDIGWNPVVKALVWHQGESDGDNESRSLEYEANFSAFVIALRAHDARLTDLPVILARVQSIGAFPYISNVRSAQDAFCRHTVAQDGTITDKGDGNGDDFSYSIDIDDLAREADNIHLNAVSQESKGVREYNVLVDSGII